MAQTEDKLLPQPQQILAIAVPTQNTRRWRANLPSRHLVDDDRENYLKFCVPLYEASIRCNWNDAKAILEKDRELVRYSITGNGETALHVAVFAKCDHKDMQKFVKNLVEIMRDEDLKLENENFNTAFYLATVAGNIEAVKIMAGRNKSLLTIPGAGKMMLPLYAAAMFGSYEVVKYLYEESRDLSDDYWNPQNRDWLLEKCVENDMCDVALKIVKKYPELGRSGSILRVLARKPEIFHVTKSNTMWTTINSACGYTGLWVKTREEESYALTLLRFIWEDIAKLPTKEIDSILSGPSDSIEQDDITVSGWAIQAMQLQKLIFEHVTNMEERIRNLIRFPRYATFSTTKLAYAGDEQAFELQSRVSEILVKMNAETEKIIERPCGLIKQENKTNSRKEDLVVKLQNLIFEHIRNLEDKTHNILIYNMEDKVPKLQQVILEQTQKMNMKTHKVIAESGHEYTKQKHSSHILFIAAERGNTKFLVELIRQYPDLLWMVNEDNQSIFHIAVKYRYEGIYNLLYEIGSMKDMIISLRDTNDNNMLHLVGKAATKTKHMTMSGAALQIRKELLWFMDVRNMIPPSCKEQKNKDGVTPAVLFLEEHRELIIEAEKWMRDTASQCMVAAALITTIAFAAIFTIPGGYNQDNGVLIFYGKPLLGAFVMADAMSLFLSSISILALLSIFKSHYAEFDFVEALSKKLMFGMFTLYLSIIAMMITFSLSLFILCNKEMIWIPIVFGLLIVPVLLYSVSQYHMFVDVIRSTYGSRYLFKPTKQSLYNVNPRV